MHADLIVLGICIVVMVADRRPDQRMVLILSDRFRVRY